MFCFIQQQLVAAEEHARFKDFVPTAGGAALDAARKGQGDRVSGKKTRGFVGRSEYFDIPLTHCPQKRGNTTIILAQTMPKMGVLDAPLI